MAYWYVDPSIAAADESDSFDGGYGSGKLRDSWADVTWLSSDDYFQAAGTEYTGDVTVGASGTAANYIVIGKYGAGPRPIIQGVNDGLSLSSRTYVQVQDLDLRAGATNKVGLVQLSAAATTLAGIKVLRCVLRGGRIGLRLRGSGNVVENCEVAEAQQDAMYMEVANTVIRGCHLHHFDLDESGVGDGIQFVGTHDHGVVVIEEMTIDGTASATSTKQCIVTAAGTAASFVIRRNYFIGMNQCVDVAIAGAHVYANVFERPVGSGRGLTINANDQRVEGNVFLGCARAISVGASTNAQCYNNTVLDCETGIVLNTVGGSATVKNNIFRTTEEALLVVATATLTSDNNAFDVACAFSHNGVSYGTLADFVSASSQDASSQSVDVAAYVRDDAALRVTADDTIASLGSSNVLAMAGIYVDGVHLKNGRLRPGFCPIGAYTAVLAGTARTA